MRVTVRPRSDDSQIPRVPTGSPFSREGRARLVTALQVWAAGRGSAGLAELRAVLLQEHVGRQREGLI